MLDNDLAPTFVDEIVVVLLLLNAVSAAAPPEAARPADPTLVQSRRRPQAQSKRVWNQFIGPCS